MAIANANALQLEAARPTSCQTFSAGFGQFYAARTQKIAILHYAVKIPTSPVDSASECEDGQMTFSRCGIGLQHLTLNVCGTSGVTKSNSVPGVSKVNLAAELQHLK